MIILRCTAKLQKFLSIPVSGVTTGDSGAEWYANLLWIQGRKCLLFCQADTLFSFFVPDVLKANVTSIGGFFVAQLTAELSSEALPPDCFGQMYPVNVVTAKTAGRSVLGSMNDQAFQCQHHVETAGGLDRLNVRELNRSLRRTPMGALKYAYPLDATKAMIGRAPDEHPLARTPATSENGAKVR